MSFAKSMGKNISKNLTGKYRQGVLDHAKKSAAYALKNVSKRSIKKKQKKKTEANGDLIGNEIAHKIRDSYK